MGVDLHRPVERARAIRFPFLHVYVLARFALVCVYPTPHTTVHERPLASFPPGAQPVVYAPGANEAGSVQEPVGIMRVPTMSVQ